MITLLNVLKAHDTLAAAEEEPLHYSCNNEFDSNVTLFEMLANARILVVSSHLPEIKQAVLVSILHALYSENYWVFNAEESGGDCIIHQDDLDDDLLSKLENYNVKAWCEYLFTSDRTPLPCDFSYDLIKPTVDLKYYSHDKYVDEYKKRTDGILPDDGVVKSPKQKIYTIDNLITMAKTARKKLN